MFGYAVSELVGQTIELLIPESLRAAHVAHRDTFGSGPRRRPMGDGPDLYARHKDGRIFPVEISLSPLGVDGGRFVVAAIRDITERKRIEEALRTTQSEAAALGERQRLARELHDSVSQALYGIGLGARTARTLLDRDPRKAAEPMDYVIQLAKAGLAEMKALIFELRPESLADEGLVLALAKQAESMQARYDVKVKVRLGAEPDLPFSHKEALFRVAQEAMHNTVKHAKATEAQLSCMVQGTEVVVEVSDDGVGFDPGTDFPGHLGLRSMRERMMQIGGGLQVVSTPGCGTQIRATISVSSQAALGRSG